MQLIKSFDFLLEKIAESPRRNGYLQTIFTLDIEVSTAYLTKNGELINDVDVSNDDFFDGMTPISLPYIWMFGINDTVYYAREFKLLRDFLLTLDSFNEKIIVYVHNYGYEFQFLLNLFTVQDVFARQTHKPIKATYMELPNIEFRCSYMLTTLSIANWGKKVGIAEKKVGLLDYKTIRTPLSDLTSENLEYCEADILVMYYGLLEYMKKYKTIENIPLTSTGTIRREIRQLLNDAKYIKWVNGLLPSTYADYERMLKSYRGGDANSSLLFVGRIVQAWFYDYKSSYPFQLCAEKYPCSPFIVVKDYKKSDDYCYILTVTFYGIESKGYCNYIPNSKYLEQEGKDVVNGRIRKAKMLSVCITDIDFEIIKKTYDIEGMEFELIQRARKDYLPKKFIEYVLNLFENKTSLDGIIAMKAIYEQSKRYINALYGMCCTSIVFDQILLDAENNWSIRRYTKEDVMTELHKRKTKIKSNNFLSFYWGSFCAAYAREKLWNVIIDYPEYIINYDTDGLKMNCEIDTQKYTDLAVEKLKKMCDHYNIEYDRFMPKTPDGETKILGALEAEGYSEHFKTLGAKRYAYIDKKGKMKVTVTGVPKEMGQYYLKSLEDLEKFDDGFIFYRNVPDDVKGCLLSQYLNDQPEIIWNQGKYDEYKSDFKYGIAMRRKSYTLGIEAHFQEAFNNIQNRQGVH